MILSPLNEDHISQLNRSFKRLYETDVEKIARGILKALVYITQGPVSCFAER